MLTSNVIDELALVDVNEDKLRGEMLDLQVIIFLNESRFSQYTFRIFLFSLERNDFLM